MIKRLFIYLIMFLLTLYLFFIYDDEILRSLIIVEVVYFIFSPIYLFSIQSKITVFMVTKSLMAERNKELSITYKVKNNSYSPIVYFRTVITMENVFSGEKKKYKSTGFVNRKETKLDVVSMKIKECGNYRVTIERIEIFDILFVFKINKSIKQSGHVGVLPSINLMPVEISRKTRDFIADAEEYSSKEGGDDPSEIFQVREYRDGDSIHDIHWKLSAKEDEIMIKENGKPLGATVLIWLNLKKIPQKTKRGFLTKLKERTRGRNYIANALEIVASLSLSLLDEKCVHMVAWYEPENKVVHKKRISKEEHIYELLYRLLYVECYQDTEEIRVQFEDAFRGVEFSTTVELCTDGTVFVEDEKITVPMKKEGINWEQFYIQV